LFFDFLLVIIVSALGLAAHAASTRRWLEWVLRIIIGVSFLIQVLLCLNVPAELLFNPWVAWILLTSCAATLLLLFMPVRKLISLVLTAFDLVISGQFFVPLLPMFRKLTTIKEFLQARTIFNPASIPHMVALYIFVITAACLLASTDPGGFNLPALPFAIPMPISQLISYNGVGLILLSFCGAGIFVSRKPREVLARLGWVKPTLGQVGIGIGLIFFSFAYDALWALYTHQLFGQDLASKLSYYNAGTFAAAGGFAPSVVLALMTALCAGVGEETLIRGALQPVFGILPAALMHGMLHGQFAHAPIFIIQVALWSVFMGIVRRYTNTTTTIIGHAGFNFVTTFLFAFNP